MRILRLGPIVAVGLLFSVMPIQAQQASSVPVQRDAQAVSVLQRSLAALVGSTNVSDVTLSGSANWIAGSDNESGSVTLKATAIGQGRIDLSLSGGQRSEVVDASQQAPTGSWCGPDGVWHAAAGHNLLSDPTWFFPTFLIRRALASTGYAISAMDTETQDGVSVEHVTIYQSSALVARQATGIPTLGQIDLYLDASTFLPTSISFNAHPDTDAKVDIPIQIKFSNYQTVQGIAVPYHIQKYIQNGLALDVTVTGVQLNSGLSATVFQAQ